MQNDIDQDLLNLFQQNSEQALEQPFLSNVTKRIERVRIRRVVARRVLQALGVIAVVLASPWLIEGSIWLTDSLETVFAAVSALLDTRLGMVVALVVSAPIIFWNRKRILYWHD